MMLMTALLLTACNYYNKVYDKYVHADARGWEKNEPITFGIDSLDEGGQFAMVLGLRIGDNYPFQNLQIVVDQTIYPSQQTLHDVIECQVTDRNGIMLGQGVSIHQHTLPVRRYHYQKGDSITVRVRHNMKREILPGIMDVGIMLKK